VPPQHFMSVDLLASGSWRAFERALFRLVLHQGFEWARLTAGSGDRGSDIFGYYRGQYWVIQAKFSLNGVPPGPRVIREELARAVSEYGASRAILATNAANADRQTVQAAHTYTKQTGSGIQVLARTGLLAAADALPEDPPALAARPLRPYQATALEAIRKAAMTRTGQRAGAIVAMATGTGKSRVMFEYVRSFLEDCPGEQVLVLVEAVELARQLERASWDVLPKGVTTHLWAGGEVPAFSCANSVTFATSDSVRGGWGILARASRFPLVVVDEAHHAAAAGITQLLDDLKPRFRLGMTATPWRGDHRRLAALFGEGDPVYQLSVTEAIRAGFLAEVEYIVFDDHVDWDEVHRLSREGLTIRDLNRRLWVPERENRIAAIVREWIDRLAVEGVPPRTIVFCRSIEHTEKARMALNAAGVPAAELHSGLEKFAVTRRLQQFRDGDIRVLAVVDMLNEGIDVPDVQLIVFNRVTHSRRVFLQQLGRGLRRTPDKDRLVVLDFVADVRRLAEILELDREYRSGPRGSEVVHVPEALVTFQGAGVVNFAEAYLKDVANLVDKDDSLLLFPPGGAPR
jgi:superfamily II DNA or RNA helicase